MHDLLNLDLDNIIGGKDYVLLSISPSEENPRIPEIEKMSERFCDEKSR